MKNSNLSDNVVDSTSLTLAPAGAINKNGGVLPQKFNGKTIEGYEIEGYFRNGKIETFYFK